MSPHEQRTPEQKRLLEEAIHRFTATSTELEKSYQLLCEQVRQLKEELEVKNKALQQSAREQERLREQAQRNDRLAAVGEMAARMAHELRNPLGSIELFVSLLRKGEEGEGGRTTPAEKEQWLEHIKTAVDAMDYALSNLLFFTGQPKPHFKETDLKKVIEEASRFAVHLLQQKEVRLVQSMDHLTCPIRCDEDLLRQAFVNLIQNAVDALPIRGTLAIDASYGIVSIPRPSGQTREEGVVVKIADTGCGIPKDRLSKIFDPFYTTKKKGTGLGLAIVHNAVSAHNGTIEVSSEWGGEEGKGGEEERGGGEGKMYGTCFTVYLPKEP